MSKLISCEKAYEVLTDYYHHKTDAQHEALREALERVAPEEPEQKTGKWLEKEVIYISEDGFALQSCKCSECGRYDTRPFMYYFSEPNYCSWCGAFNGKPQKGEGDVEL